MRRTFTLQMHDRVHSHFCLVCHEDWICFDRRHPTRLPLSGDVTSGVQLTCVGCIEAFAARAESKS